MTTLNLKKQCGGYYSNKFDGITITVSNPYQMMRCGSNEWQITIENEKEVLMQTYFKTKKDAMQAGVNFVIENF